MFIGTKKEYIRSGPKLYYSILGFSELIYDICVENYLDYNYISFSVNKEIIYNKNTSEMNCGKLDMFIDQDNALPVGFVLFSDFNIILTPKDESNIKQGIISYKSVYMGDEEREKTASSIIRIPVTRLYKNPYMFVNATTSPEPVSEYPAMIIGSIIMACANIIGITPAAFTLRGIYCLTPPYCLFPTILLAYWTGTLRVP